MKKQIFPLILCTFASLLSPVFAMDLQEPLRSHKRPPHVQAQVDQKYDAIKVHKVSSKQWTFNGKELYAGCGMNEHELFAYDIKRNYPAQSVFRAGDVGAGDSRWVYALANFINKKIQDGKLPQDITVHILGVGGESCEDIEAEKKGNCRIYIYGQFKIEEFDEELNKREAWRNQKFDFLVTQMCSRHLSDFLGTFPRLYNRLKSQRFFTFDKFFFLYENELSTDYLYEDRLRPLEHMLSLLLDTGAPFLFESYNSRECLTPQNFILKKPDCKKEYVLPWEYASSVYIFDTHGPLNSAAHCLTVFINKKGDKKVSMPDKETDKLYGNENLYNELNQAKVWVKEPLPYRQIEWQ